MRVLLRSLVQDDGLSVFVSSHLLSEVDQVADNIGVLHDGRLRYQGSLAALRASLRSTLDVRKSGVRVDFSEECSRGSVGESGVDHETAL